MMGDGKVVSLFSEGRQNSRLSQHDVTNERLGLVLESAVIDYDVDDDGDIYIKDGVQFPFWIWADTKTLHVRFYTFWESDGASIELTNGFNKRFRVVQFYLEGRVIKACYDMTFRYGLDCRQLVVMLRQFGEVCHAAMTQALEQCPRQTASEAQPFQIEG
jgi:hypothetical protein